MHRLCKNMGGKFVMKYVSWNFFNFINYVKDSTIPRESLHPYDILPPVSAAYYL